MSGGAGVAVDVNVWIPANELSFRASRSGGPGGQHVNTSSTRVELVWNLDRTGALSDEQRARVRGKLGTRVDGQGNIRVVASAYRSQARNRDDALTRLAALLHKALAVPKARKKTRPGRGAVESRLKSKRRHQEKKARRRVRDDE